MVTLAECRRVVIRLGYSMRPFGEAYLLVAAVNEAILALARHLTGDDTALLGRGHSTPCGWRDPDART